MKLNRKTVLRRSAHLIFWSWHLIYVILALTVIFPHLAMPMFSAAVDGLMPFHYTLYVSAILTLPFVSILLAVRVFRFNPVLLMKYFYGFEMAMLFFVLVRMLTFRDFNPGLFWLIANVFIALTAWLLYLLQENRAPRQFREATTGPMWTTGSTIIGMVGLYFGLLFLIIMIPLSVEFIKGLFHILAGLEFKALIKIFVHPLMWLSSVFVLFTASLFIVLPLAMIWLYLGHFKDQVVKNLNPGRAIVVFAVFIINVSGFFILSQQPQQEVFRMLDEKMGQSKYEQELLDKAPLIRAALLNGYLARYRYISSTGLSRRMEKSYRESLLLSKSAADKVQQLFNALSLPFLYEGENWSDVKRAEKYYGEFFDTPIQKSERDTVFKAIKRTWNIMESNEAGLLSAEKRFVHINRQSINVTEEHGAATITISQTLENQTFDVLEALIHFTLPEDAVVSGLWLSDDPAHPQKYPCVVAPKGAAQSVYKAEVARRVDPALLEQTGPYQYRLRVYPIPAKPRHDDHGDHLYMRLEYQTLPDVTGKWPLPRILEKRNLYWDDDTEYRLNNKDIQRGELDTWLPPQAALAHNPPSAGVLTFVSGDKVVRAVAQQAIDQGSAAGLRLAVLIDGSYSMTINRNAISSAINELEAAGVDHDLYFCRRECTPLQSGEEISEQSFFGNSQPLDQLGAFQKISTTRPHQAILLLTDEASYELAAESSGERVESSKPFWLVHLDDRLPYAYNDKLLDLIYRSHGGICQSIREVLFRLNPRLHLSAGGDRVLAISRDRIWFERDAAAGDIGNSTPSLEKITAAHRIRKMIRILDTEELSTLDTIHQLAQKYNIVTHYSSMLVLVNDRQKEALKTAEQDESRFEREVEDGHQDSSTPLDPFSVPSVPEPEEWALIVIGLIFLGCAIRRRQQGYLVQNIC
ncbi:MAG: TIGR02921 family PEP-CTERM protein [Thermodesulfobacteriota bacterium]